MTLIVFLFILSLLILVHEFGHFYAARKNGVLVEEFGLGMPPAIFKKKVGETVYSLNWLPFGGFVKLFGEDESEDPNALAHPRSFLSKKPWQRAIIIVSGVTMNFLLSLCLYYLFFFSTGFKTFTLPILFDYNFRFGEINSLDTVVVGFLESTNAEEAGVTIGEAIIAVDGYEVKNIPEIKEVLSGKGDQTVNVTLLDMNDPSTFSTRNVEFATAKDEEGNNILGIYMARAAQIYYPNKITAGLEHSYNVLAYSFTAMKKFIGMSISSKSTEPVAQSFTGPIGIYSVVGSILELGDEQVVLGLLDFTALISLSLALLNIMPLPALDGGRLVFIFIELITGKRPSIRFEATVHKYGILFFFGLLILVSIKDIWVILGS